MCRNPKLWIALGAVAVVILVAAPSVGAVLPILLVAACPLSMLLMAGGMARMAGRGRGNAEDAATADSSELARLRGEVAELRQPAQR
jgi:hypothetical protein